MSGLARSSKPARSSSKLHLPFGLKRTSRPNLSPTLANAGFEPLGGIGAEPDRHVAVAKALEVDVVCSGGEGAARRRNRGQTGDHTRCGRGAVEHDLVTAPVAP